MRDATGVAKYRHEAIAVVLQVRPVEGAEVLSVLAWRRTRDPFAGCWALPSGPVEVDEPLGESVRRHLADKVDLSEIAHLEQLATLSDPARDPFERTIATAYLGLVPWTERDRPLTRAEWLPVAAIARPNAKTVSGRAETAMEDRRTEMAFDHAEIVAHGVRRMRAKLSYTNLGFALAPPEFTLAHLRDIYAEALDHEVSVTNLHRILTRRGQLEATGEISPSGSRGGRPSKLFRFISRSLQVTDPFAVLRPGPVE